MRRAILKSLCFSLVVAVYSFTTGCNRPNTTDKKRFKRVPTNVSGVVFSNDLTESDTLNYFTYPYIYMGGGVAIGDFNNDGLQDLYFTGNMVSNKLYLNRGNMQFEDNTTSSGVAGDDRWYTGVTLADVNADGYLDIYLSVSGLNGIKENQLFINNGDLTFSDRAQEYGMADPGQSIQSAFFDYDKDGDLDLFVANYPIAPFNTPNFVYRKWMQENDPVKSDKLYRNEKGTFVDVTQEAGLQNFGLSIGISITDLNQDGWEDIYVSNDFSTPDYLYLNNGDGTFTDQLKQATKQTAFYGMGVDAADINNDGLMDFMQVDMAAQDNRRSKANMASMNPALFWSTVNAGFHYQYMYNALQLNRGIDPNNLPIFSNVAWISGVSSTDWSWAPLFADFDNDGWKDLFISNGTRKEINNRDFFKSIEGKRAKMSASELFDASLKLPSEPIDNYMFRNMDGLNFSPVNQEWGIHFNGFSNGASYGDLDNDGDLDLVLNNIDSMAVIHQNLTSEEFGTNYLRLQLKSPSKNIHAIGSSVKVVTGSNSQFLHLALSRGFQSSIEPFFHVGMGDHTQADSIIVTWPDGTLSYQLDVPVNQLIEIEYQNTSLPVRNPDPKTMFTAATGLFDTAFLHQENIFDDYRFQVLLPHKMSNLGPALATGDVNGDSKEDVFVGNGAGYAAKLYIQNEKGTFVMTPVPAFEEDAGYEDISATFFDVDNDGDNDLYVVSGGNAFPADDPHYQDRLYLNDNGTFQRAMNILPDGMGSGACVKPYDFDNDGDLDLFVGGRHHPRNYPNPGKSHLLINTLDRGRLGFEDLTDKLAPGLKNTGMVTDALWMDFDGDNLTDLVIVGEWMPVTIFKNVGHGFIDHTKEFGWDQSAGWWFSIDTADFDHDGDQDIVVGNLGLNYKYQASDDEPFDIFFHDFDNNSSSDIVLGYYNEGTQFPVRGRQCSSEQIPTIKVVFEDYNSFANATLKDIYGAGLEEGLHYSVSSFSSVYLENQGGGVYKKTALPQLAQISTIDDLLIYDFNEDGDLDLLLAGNLYASEVETPRSDASIGQVLLGDGKGGFESLHYKKSGLRLDQDVQALQLITIDGEIHILAANNQGPLQAYKTSIKKETLE
ncbi:hypothetical protein FNH22_04590 [Fulvivirga sp. M361]|uniref:VCBS repeat-containing protein n=1 Tax=Fulvivirga sp. M361 TaxID=2594266 RepID=UPI00117B1E92|nr:VCBS repeat-containing protein [Fulvivirga sp. M361]TRX61338.1 hypothetical protein FNH22_04590 [Fulvivirga sp. M361]